MISVQIEYNGKKEEVLLNHPTRKDRKDYLLQIRGMKSREGDDNFTDEVLEFVDYRERLVLKLGVKAPFPLTEEGLDSIPVVELEKIVSAIEGEVNLNAGFRVPSNGQPPVALEES